MIYSKKILMNMETGLYYCGTYSGEICWDEHIGSATDVRECEWSFYPWEIDELSEMTLEVKEIVEYFLNE